MKEKEIIYGKRSHAQTSKIILINNRKKKHTREKGYCITVLCSSTVFLPVQCSEYSIEGHLSDLKVLDFIFLEE